MNYCVYLKKRKNKPFCKLENKEITFDCCRECVNKEYHLPDARKMVTNRHQLSNNHQIRKSPLLKEKSPHRGGKIKNKSNKLAKLERNRKSVFTEDLEHCYLCGRKKEELHEIFAGRNRINSIKYNFVLPLCHECHSLNQNNAFFNDYWHKIGQEYFECNFGSREEFLAVFRRNYLD